MGAIEAILVGLALSFLILSGLGAFIMLAVGAALVGVVIYERVLAHKTGD